MPHSQRHQTVTWIADTRHAGIAHDGNIITIFQVHNQLWCPFQLVVLVIADGTLLNPVMIQQLLRLAGVLAGNEIDLFQRTQGA